MESARPRRSWVAAAVCASFLFGSIATAYAADDLTARLQDRFFAIHDAATMTHARISKNNFTDCQRDLALFALGIPPYSGKNALYMTQRWVSRVCWFLPGCAALSGRSLSRPPSSHSSPSRPLSTFSALSQLWERVRRFRRLRPVQVGVCGALRVAHSGRGQRLLGKTTHAWQLRALLLSRLLPPFP